MISFHVPLKTRKRGDAKEFFSFALKSKSTILFAGSRNRELSKQVCHDLVCGFARLGFSFIVGDAKGIDASFRYALAEAFPDRTFIACAYPYRVHKITGLPAELVVPDNIHPKVAPRVRTLHMVDCCDMAVVFADDVTTGSW